MAPATLQQISEAVGGRIVGDAAAPATISTVCHDSRQPVERGCLFVALRGENFDGHDFLGGAASAGAAAALVDHVPPIPPAELTLVVAENTRKGLGRLAAWARQQLRGTVIAVGGSNGKTGTKHLIHAALGQGGGGLTGTISPKSFNNDIGVPLAILPADPSDDYLVLEMGTNHHGELRVLSEMARPDVGVITSISAEHLEGLGDLDGVRREESTITAGLKEDGLLVVNGDDAGLTDCLTGCRARRITFGFGEHNDLCVRDLAMDDRGVRFRVGSSREFVVPVLGRHSASNAAAAIAIARHLGIADDRIAAGLAGCEGPAMRLQLREVNGFRILNDAYNANPASMRAAIEMLFALDCRGRRIAVLGEMRELGLASEDAHREMGRYVTTQAIDHLLCVGANARLIAQEAISGGFSRRKVHCSPDSATAGKVLAGMAKDGDTVLLKGSRGVKLELVEQALMALHSLQQTA